VLTEEAIGGILVVRDTCEGLILSSCAWLYSQSRFYHRHWDDRREFTRTTILNYALKRSGCLEADASWLCESREQIKIRCQLIFFTQSVPQWWKIGIVNIKCSNNALHEGRSEGKRVVNLDAKARTTLFLLNYQHYPLSRQESQVSEGISCVVLRSALRLLLVPPSTKLPIPQASKRLYTRQFELNILLQLLP
jgi:hypothetical protein